MTTSTLTIATGPYDTTRALFDGAIEIPGRTLEMRTGATLPEIFERMVRHQEFDVAEVGWEFWMRGFGPDTPFRALPIFPNRVFRHSSVYVNLDSGISEPADLVGKTIGEFGMYGQDSGVWVKGALSDDYGFRPEANSWVIGGLDKPTGPFEFVPQVRPEGIDIVDAPEGRALADMLEEGEIDALFTANVPQLVLDGTAERIGRLFPDHVRVERDWYRRTHIYPMMHPVVIRKELLDEPGVARDVYDAFVASKQAAFQRYDYARRLNGATMMLPFAEALMDENTELFKGDWWPYGTAANRTSIDAFLRYHHEQGLSDRRLALDEVFAAELLDT